MPEYQVIKSDIMPQVKSTKLRPDVQPNPEWKKELTKLRRQIIPKIGQITNTQAAVERISSQLDQILAPSPRHPQALYVALLYVVSKAVLKQAEEEVTVKPSTAFPLARVVMALVEQGHDLLGTVFVAKLISMSSHWIVGTVIGREPNQSDEDYRKSLGYRPASSGETTPQYIERMGGLVTLYAAILQTPIQTTTSREAAQRIPAYLRFPRFWTWLARLVGNSDLMSDPAASHLLACALETAGDRAMEVWGKQMVKLRAALGRKAFEADGSVHLLGGEEGKAGRIRLGLLLDAWQKNGAIHPPGREYDE
ncbi:hypothetical protein BS47DRAFT_1397742 [Hydnum rufescens UP504]|uniref:mRNA export factor GLE1 n=1 Tax=Hydnum rufescens UP504 TaxID=1448309 RepID=A0A9P6ANH7_9AGAM|nr:hypothetical protein BS47DRAFT_1397742 [Hydnum rufescens UP504]